MLEIINSIGIWSSILFFFITIVCLYKQSYYLGGYLVFFSINEVSNMLFKTIIKEKRPDFGTQLVDESILDNNQGTDTYGMPSHHTQSLLFSCVYLYFVKQLVWITIIELFIIGVTMYQRYYTKRHTMEQLLVGSLVGGIIGYFSYISTKQYIYHHSAFYNKISL